MCEGFANSRFGIFRRVKKRPYHSLTQTIPGGANSAKLSLSMGDLASVSLVVVMLVFLVATMGLAALVLYGQDRIAITQGKTAAQVHDRFLALLHNLRVLYAVDRSRLHESAATPNAKLSKISQGGYCIPA
jgi:hypothetical protein